MADLFQRNKSTISRHIGNIYKEGELDRTATVAKFATVQMEGERQVERRIEYYNLDVIISVGYRVKSQRGVQFRMWATAILKEFMKKGFVLDDDRLKNLGGGNYFDELLARIRDIRSSEKVFWRKVLEIYATSIDYDPKAEKQRQRLLKLTLSQYKNRTCIAMGVSVTGVIAALICDLAFLKAVLGFFLGAIFFAASIVCQAVFINKAFSAWKMPDWRKTCVPASKEA